MELIDCKIWQRARGARWGTLSARIALAGLVLSAVIVPAHSTSLSDALRSAYRYNPELEAERARLRATDEGVTIARSGLRPTLNGEYSATYRETNTDPASATDGSVTPQSFALSLNQNVFTGFQVTNAVNEAEAQVRAGQQQLRTVEQAVLLDAATAYVDVVRDLAIVDLRTQNLEFLSRQLSATQDRFQVGEVTRTDVAQARARRAAARSQLDLAGANLKSSRARYTRIVGGDPSGLRQPPEPMRLLPNSLGEATDIALRQNPSVISALYTEQAARFTVRRLTGALLPQVDVNASYTATRDPSRGTDFRESGEITGRVTIPLYQGGRGHAEVRQAKHTHVSRLQEVEQRRTEARESAISAWSLLEASRAQLVSDRAQVEANQIALEGVREEERVGQRTLLDVLDARQELLDSQVDLTTTQRDIIVNAYMLLAAVGRLDMIQLGLTETVYDPDAHYHEVRRKWFGLSITHGDGRVEHMQATGDRSGPLK